MPVTARNVGSDLVGDITNTMLAFCYDFEVEFIFHQQVQRTVLHYSYHSDYIQHVFFKDLLLSSLFLNSMWNI